MDWPISWGKVKSQLSVAPPLYLKEPVNITWDGKVKEENRFDDAVRIYDGVVDAKDLDGGTMSCKTKDGTIYTGTCYDLSKKNAGIPSDELAPFFVIVDEYDTGVFTIGCKYSKEDREIIGGYIVPKEVIDFPLPIGVFTPADMTDTTGQIISIKGVVKNSVQISDPYKDFFAAMPRGVYNITIENFAATPAGTEITDEDLIAQLNKLPKQAGFLMNVSIPAANSAISAYPSFFKEGEAYAYVINLGDSSTLMFSNENGAWKLYR